MVVIEKLIDRISDEISDAKTYASMAVEYRDSCPCLAKTLYGISLEESDHMKRLREAAEEVIAKYRETKGEPPADVMAVYNYMQKQQIAAAAEAKIVQSMYRDN